MGATMNWQRWRGVASTVLLLIAITPLVLLSVRALVFGVPPQASIVVVLTVAYCIGGTLFVLPWVPHLRTWRASARLRRRHRGSTVLAIRDVRLADQAHVGRGLVPVSSGGVIVADVGRISVYANDAHLSSIWQAMSSSQMSVTTTMAPQPYALLAAPEVAEIHLSSDEAVVRFTLLTPTPASDFRASEAETRKTAEALNGLVNSSNSSSADRPV
jgi:hypothetical protein